MLKHLAAGILCAVYVITGCSTSGARQSGHFSQLKFDLRPNGEIPQLTQTRPQLGSGVAGPITRQSFEEITIAQGAGLEGFASIRIFADGSGYAIIPATKSRAQKVSFHLSGEECDLLIGAINADRLNGIKGSYSSGWADGTQGFVELITSEGRVHSWLDNYFVPVAHLYTFCNVYIWGDVIRASAIELPRDYTAQEEYHRIFPRP